MSGEAVPMIKLEQLEKQFITREGIVKALDGVNLAIGAGEVYGIIGMSGAGKSTLVRCMNFLEHPTRGTVWIDGQDLSLLTHRQLREVRKRVSMIFQHFNLLMQKTVLGNVLFALKLQNIPKADAITRARELLCVVGLTDKELAYPSQLSGGQKQRVAIARALATDPRVLLCDEATSALDPMTTKSILELLQRLNRQLGLTIVIITHEMAVIRQICTRVAVMENARVVEEGSVEEIFTHPKSAAARRMFFPQGEPAAAIPALHGRLCRVIFEGQEALEPYIAQAVLETKVMVSVLRSDFTHVGSRVYGQMALSLPDDNNTGVFMDYLRARGLIVEEVEASV